MIRYRLRQIEALLSRLSAAVRGQPRVRPGQLKSAADVLAVLEEQVEILRAETTIGSVERARTIAYLTSIARQAIETSDLALRLEMLEAVLEQRSKKP
jgi:hypothetical protein